MRKSLIDKLRSPIVIQFLPTLRDIEIEEVKDLARRLKGESIKETLTNILEWQDRNVKYWAERGILEAQWLFLAILIPTIIFYCIFTNTNSASLLSCLNEVIISQHITNICVNSFFGILDMAPFPKCVN